MWLIDQLAEQYITEAQKNGEFDNLAGKGKRLKLDDDSHVPVELRAAYRLMKNSGFLPPELEMRREAISLNELLTQVDPGDQQYDLLSKRLTLLRIKLQQAGMSTDFLQSEYAPCFHHRFNGEE
ncbi:DUF1992 domain-containing protein [Erwinia mallotivora]|uniref:DnaJ homologue subfamily C member 28 conserved domain-containing protein n=1 Tax=Erwinia mallotivora TaxID=69222 RepID=A0A014NJ92_9GAMM|nr:DUF1992 domain-containing protein [Erwinia mallotivora]EXU73865.1 hypothetical protein BG55_20415 [Erwinia mallotivora]